VLVEGPMDAIAVTLATAGEYTGVAALGTALTREQARQLRRYTDVPIVATDNDKAGQAAAERAYWILTDLGHDPLHAALPEGTDPADFVAQERPQDLSAAICASVPLSLVILRNATAEPARDGSITEAIRVIGAASPVRWSRALAELAGSTGIPVQQLQAGLASRFDRPNTPPQPRRQARTASEPGGLIPNSDPASTDEVATARPSDSINP
jgi:DNA primase